MGRDGPAALIDGCCRHAVALARGIGALDGAELVAMWPTPSTASGMARRRRSAFAPTPCRRRAARIARSWSTIPRRSTWSATSSRRTLRARPMARSASRPWLNI
ncbi:Hypothetical protein GbCGDNIH9_8713 [Granulibacter bethesdensis]|uniref:Uncharacterized protein n=1 Tax=Granulibacter bethesdensis TaxID=364410 RepID=A0AAC9P8H2_9PROT|nr:Hypothetical protein GbCGDNIH9_8713 [Granulibacter bethesdensis]APH61767.1 Hypothetical protein GbCGDNIH8_8713 [Granulibacter bethesdensis]